MEGELGGIEAELEAAKIHPPQPELKQQPKREALPPELPRRLTQ